MAVKKPRLVLFSDIHELMSLSGAVAKKGRGPMLAEDLSVAKKQVMVCADGKILWTGTRQKIPREFRRTGKEVSLKANVFPGFIDCHTHSLFLGDRKHEFELRNQGATYQDIAKQGGGILFTVRSTRAGSEAQLAAKLSERLEVFADQGVTTVEIKSGYGLSTKDEIKMLSAIRKARSPVKKVPTFLGAHALPPEFSSATEYLKELKKTLQLIRDKKLANRVDIFVEQNYFSVDEARDYLQAARELGFELTVHADQLTRTGAAVLAAELGAVSADHVIQVHEADIAKLAGSDITCVLLPASDFYLRCAYPPARQLIDRGARVALSTDFNPGTSPTQNIQLVGVLARLEMKMKLPEVFVALTLGGAHALGLASKRGALLPGFEADFFTSDRGWGDFFYDLQPVEVKSLWIDGVKRSRSR